MRTQIGMRVYFQLALMCVGSVLAALLLSTRRSSLTSRHLHH